MRIAVLGSGGREHALAHRFVRNGHRVLGIPGNAGFLRAGADYAPRCSLSDHAGIRACLSEFSPDLVVIGPEAPLAEGLSDALRAGGYRVFGPNQGAARLESSKVFAKAFMERHGIPTAPFQVLRTPEEGVQVLKGTGTFPVVLKADGLFAGKGVVVAREREEALAALPRLFRKKEGGYEPVILEQFLAGEELSFHVLLDNQGAIPLLPAQDHKRAFEFEEGPNTGGMGAYAPTRILTPRLRERIMERIVRPTWEGLQKEGLPYEGVLYCGLMIAGEEPYVLEYNVRFGDPECQVLMALWDGDVGEELLAIAQDEGARISPTFKPGFALCVVLASGGYPGAVQEGVLLPLPEHVPPGVTLHFAGVREEGGRLYSHGGRVLHVVAQGSTLEVAYNKAYEAVSSCAWYTAHLRRDIGLRELARELKGVRAE